MNTLSEQQVFAAAFGLQGPFVLSFPNGDELLVEQVLRLLPGKRLACKAQWRGQTVFAKLFKRQGLSAAAAREADGHASVQVVEINTPALLERQQYPASELLLFEFLDDGETLAQRLQKCSKPELTAYCRSALAVLETLHQHQLVHTDPHFANFYISGEKFFLLDMGAITPLKSEQERLGNTALFLSQLLPQNEAAARSLSADDARGKEAYAGVEAQHQLREKAYLKKIFRNSTETVHAKTFSLETLCKRQHFDDEMAHFLANIESYFGGSEMLKDGNSSTVVLVSLAGRKLVLKRYNAKSRLKFLLRLMGRSRAENSWYFSHKLTKMGVPVPAPLAMVVKRFGLLKMTSYFVSEYVPGRGAGEVFTEEPPSEAIVNSFVKVFTALQKSGIIHGDMKPSNWLTNGERLWLIDFDGMSEGNRKGFAKDTQRFLRGWLAQPKLQDLFRRRLDRD